MKKLTLTIVLLVGNLSQLQGSADPAAQQLLVTAKRQANLFHDQARPLQLDVDFFAQINVPAHGHLTEKWEAKDRWWRRIVMGDFEQIDIRNGDTLYTSRSMGFTPLRIKELVSLLHFAEGYEGLLAKKQRNRTENGMEMSCLQVGEEKVRGKPHQVCVRLGSQEIVSDEWQEPPDERRKEQYNDYIDFEGHRYPRKLQLLVNGVGVVTANVGSLKTVPFDQSLLIAPKGGRRASSMRRYEAPRTRENAGPDVPKVCQSKWIDGRHDCRHDYSYRWFR